MKTTRPSTPLALTILWLLALLLSSATLPQGNARAAVAPTTLELIATDDARIQAGSPDVNYPGGFLYFSTLNSQFIFTKFDLLALPANATIDSAELRLNFTSVITGPNDIEVGRAGAPPWDETTLTWNTQPTITWGGPVKTVNANGIVAWDVTTSVQGWHSGVAPNNGFTLRGNGGRQVIADSKETCPATNATCIPPTLAITYSTPPPAGARPDLGDAPDSSNHVGIANTAYIGVNGSFPTVWSGTPANQPAGPRHENLTGEGILGNFLSRENEADAGPDEDTINNILDGGADNANNDRGDDGWRNRTASFNHCERTTLDVRVSKAPAATRDIMYLNVWFDGAHDGDWDDVQRCQPDGESLDVPAYEWIVQDYVVDMTAIAAGGFADIAVTSQIVLNTSPDKAHWLRFTLSEERAVRAPNGRADGRGPNPNGALGAYQFGETEDVVQKPHPAGEHGTLELEKRVITGGEPVDFGGMVSYEVLLRHVGGSQPIQAKIRDALPYPLHVHPQPVVGQPTWVAVESATGGAAPLLANLDTRQPQPGSPPQQSVTWQGTLAPNSEVKLTFDVHVLPLCQPNQQTQTITNIAQAQAQGAGVISDQVDFSAKCPGYNELDIEIGGVIDIPIDPTTPNSVLFGGTITNNHARPVTLGLTGLRNGQPTIAQPSFQQQITLEPGESKPWEFSLNMEDESTDELTAPSDAPLTGGLAFCILPGEGDTQCPDAQAFPFLHGQGQPINITPRPRDLGDAPDSTNHFNMPMSAYVNVQANFPTVFDPATGLPEGPLHAHPRPLHLGPQVSREAEADVGPDQDALNNIEPQNNNPNNDRFDDGVNPNLWNLAQCQTSNVPVRVFISPQAEAWFQQQNETAYLNIWLDANRDGDWADGTACGANAATEHIVIDFPVDVAALGAGLQIVNVPTKLVPWPAALEQAPAWVRVTLSERLSNKTLQFGATSHGDGRGHPVPFKTGETEDYLMHPEGNPNAGPNVGVQLSGAITSGGNVGEQSVFKIDYANDGSRPASGAVLTLTKPEQLRDLEVVLLEAPGIPASDILDADMEIRIKLPTLPVGTSGSITVGWVTSSSALAAARLATTDAYSASVAVALSGDTDASNNAAAATAQRAPQAPIVAARVGEGKAWGFAETTCRNTVKLAGKGAPDAATDLLVDGKIVTTIFDDPFFFDVNGLRDGRHTIQAVVSGQTSAAIVSPRDPASGLTLDVNQSLPIDPLSLTFTDSQGRSFHPSTLGFSFGASNPASFLRSGETYQVAVDSCVDDPNMQVSLSIIAVLIGLLNDDDGDGRYTGSFTYNPSAQTAAAAPNELRLHVASGGTTQSFAAALGAPAEGTVRDALTRQPLANASVAALLPNGGAWPAGALGQPNPQLTGSDGGFSFTTPGGTGRLAATHDGYQPYRSWELGAANGVLATQIDLTPGIAGAATHTIYLTERGFEPAVVRAAPGSVIEVVNMGLSDHSASGAAADSGALAPGQRYRFKLGAPGSYSLADRASPLDAVTLIVAGGNRIFLPLVAR